MIDQKTIAQRIRRQAEQRADEIVDRMPGVMTAAQWRAARADAFERSKRALEALVMGLVTGKDSND